MDAAEATARLTTAEAMLLLILFLRPRECGVCVGGLGEEEAHSSTCAHDP